MLDIEYLKSQIRKYKFYSRSTNTDKSGFCTVEDLNKIIDHTAALMEAFVSELEKIGTD